jgi:hypothetical protein
MALMNDFGESANEEEKWLNYIWDHLPKRREWPSIRQQAAEILRTDGSGSVLQEFISQTPDGGFAPTAKSNPYDVSATAGTGSHVNEVPGDDHVPVRRAGRAGRTIRGIDRAERIRRKYRCAKNNRKMMDILVACDKEMPRLEDYEHGDLDSYITDFSKFLAKYESPNSHLTTALMSCACKKRGLKPKQCVGEMLKSCL